MQTIDIVTIRLLVAIAKEGSITQAARREHIATSAASKRISDLEEMLKVRLLRRLPRGVDLTPAGAAFVARGEQMLAIANSLFVDLESFRDGLAGEVRVSAITSALNGDLPGQLKAFNAAYPGITLRLRELYSREAVDAVKDGSIDLAVISGATPCQGLTTTYYADDPLWVIAPKGHPLFRGRKAGEPVAFSEVIRHPFVSLHEGGTLDERLSSHAAALGVSIDRSFRVMRFDSLRRLVETGFGIGFLKYSSVHRHLDTLDGAPIEDDWANMALVLCHRDETALSAAARRLRDHILAGSQSGIAQSDSGQSDTARKIV